MRILFALSQIELTGAETYALTLGHALHSLGHSLAFVSDTLRDSGDLRFIPLPIHEKNASYWGRFQNVRALKRILEEEKCELLHAHSRAANLISHFAARWGRRIPMAVTVHGRWRNHFAFRALPCLGDHTLAVCPALERYLVQDIGIPRDRVSMVPNGVDTDRFAPGGEDGREERDLLCVGRFSGQKGQMIRFLIEQVFPELARRKKGWSLGIAALGPQPEDYGRIRKLNEAAGRPFARLIAWTRSLPELYRSGKVIVGSGRVALEALASGRPVVAVGESSAPGLLTPETFARAFDDNFGDCGPWDLFRKENRLVEDLERILGDPSLQEQLSAWGRKVILEQFEARSIAARVEEVYRRIA